MTTNEDVARWKKVLSDPSAIKRKPEMIQGVHPNDDDSIIRLAISRDHAAGFFNSPLFSDLDVAVISATCWKAAADEQVDVDEVLFKAHLIELLGEVHEFAAFPYAMGSPNVSYRALLLGKDQKPRIPTERQMVHLWGDIATR